MDADFANMDIEGTKRTRGEDEDPWKWECPHRTWGWSYSVMILFVAALLVALLVYCNLQFLCIVNMGLYTTRPSHYDTRTVLIPEEAIYKVNLLTDVQELWTGCITLFGVFASDGNKKCIKHPDVTTNHIIAGMIFFWSICFPFLKILISLSFWFFPCPSWIRTWTMWGKVQIGRWSILESFFVFFWVFGFHFDYTLTEAEKIIDDLQIHLNVCLHMYPTASAFCIAQIGSLMLSHYTMKRVEYMHDKNFVIERDDNIFGFPWLWSTNVYHTSQLQSSGQQLITAGTIERETDHSDGETDDEPQYKEAYVCPWFWSFQGVLPNVIVWLLVVGNIILLIELLFIQESFTCTFHGSVTDAIPELKNTITYTMWQMVEKAPSAGCGWMILIDIIFFAAVVFFPFLSSISLLLFWTSLFIPQVPNGVRAFLRQATAVSSVYSCIDVCVMAQWFSLNFWPEIMSSLFGSMSISATWVNHEAYYLCMIYPAIHWITMTHCLTTPFLNKQDIKFNLDRYLVNDV